MFLEIKDFDNVSSLFHFYLSFQEELWLVLKNCISYKVWLLLSPLGKGHEPFFLTNMHPLYPRMSWAKFEFDGNYLINSGEHMQSLSIWLCWLLSDVVANRRFNVFKRLKRLAVLSSGFFKSQFQEWMRFAMITICIIINIKTIEKTLITWFKI